MKACLPFNTDEYKIIVRSQKIEIVSDMIIVISIFEREWFNINPHEKSDLYIILVY
ncbi:hypothetical protein ISR2_1112 [Streptococcus pyogenes]|nr:hypothetical protein ISR2_1112 [Streptococcus pyogenes]